LAVVALWLRVGMVESQVFREGDAGDSAEASHTAGGSASSAPGQAPSAGPAAEDPAAEVGVDQGARLTARDGLGAEAYSPEALKPLNPTLSIVMIFFLVSGVAASNYTWTSYVSTYAQTQEGMDP